MNQKIGTIVIHLAAWICILLLPMLLIYKQDAMHHPSNFNTIAFVVISIIYLIEFFYLNYYFLIPRFFVKKHFAIYASINLAILGLFMTMHHFQPDIPMPRADQMPPGAPSNLFFPIILFLLFWIISSSFRIFMEWFRIDKLNADISRDKLQTELSFLKAQINPHFLYNILNNIHTLALRKSDMTADAIMKLSQMIGYLMQESNADFVLLEKELDYIRQYLALQKIRLADKADVSFEITGLPYTCEIPPLILIPFIENAFQYGVSPREVSPIRISIEITGTQLTLIVQNNKYISNNEANESSGIGILNTKRRLDLLYPGRHKLMIDDAADHYHVHLMLQIK